jgi:hypothetical protein
MKTKFFVLFFMIFLSVFAKAEVKTYRHDYSECKYGENNIVLEIRSPQLYASAEESEYGEVIVLRQNGKNKTIDMNDNGIGRYRMVKLMNDNCSSVLAIPFNKDEIAFFLLKDNRPMIDYLTVLYYNTKSGEAEVIPTKISVKTALLRGGKAFFRIGKEASEQKYATKVLNNQKFNTIEKQFESLISFDGTHFKTDRDMSYDYFEYKHLLPRGTFDGIKDLNKVSYQVATSGNKTCLSFDNGEWFCK